MALKLLDSTDKVVLQHVVEKITKVTMFGNAVQHRHWCPHLLIDFNYETEISKQRQKCRQEKCFQKSYHFIVCLGLGQCKCNERLYNVKCLDPTDCQENGPCLFRIIDLICFKIVRKSFWIKIPRFRLLTSKSSVCSSMAISNCRHTTLVQIPSWWPLNPNACRSFLRLRFSSGRGCRFLLLVFTLYQGPILISRKIGWCICAGKSSCNHSWSAATMNSFLLFCQEQQNYRQLPGSKEEAERTPSHRRQIPSSLDNNSLTAAPPVSTFPYITWQCPLCIHNTIQEPRG